MAEIIKAGENFYYCSECKNASNQPNGIPHSPNCSLPDQYKSDLRGRDRDEWRHEAAEQQRLK